MRIISGKARGTKLFTLEGLDTRPTLDRIKEPLFSIIQTRIPNAIVLDLFSGSGALGIESLSRGASTCVLCDKSYKATNVIRQNLIKTKLEEQSLVYTMDYRKCLEKVKDDNLHFDIIFLDPPYNSDFIYQSVKKIKDLSLLKDDGIIIVETDNEEEIKKDLDSLDINIINIRKYGRVKLLFLN